MPLKLTGTVGPFDTDVKRFGLPGVKLEGVCPKCQAPFSRDFTDQYLSYPRANETIQVGLYCGPCEHEWEVPMRLRVTLELVEPGIKRLPRASRSRP
jgi:hypothetical protein